MPNYPTIETKNDFITHYAALKEQFEEMRPEQEITVRDPDMDVEGYIVVWNTGISADGPLHLCAKGGTRIKPDLQIEDVMRLSCAMAEKNAAAGLPLGGAKAGLKADPNAPCYEKKFKRFVELCKPFLHENGGAYGGFGYDIGGKPPYNAIWACEALGSHRSFTGKPVEMGGTDYDKEGIAGLGVAVAGKVMLERNDIDLSDAMFAVQGVGAMGAAVVRYFSEYGGKLKSLSDPKYGGSWLFNNHASEELVEALVQQDVDIAIELLSVQAEKLSDDCSLSLYQDVDIIFPCALEDAITAENAHQIKARHLCEAANNPTTDEAHQILHANGVAVVPDIIANPGGIIAAFVELTSDVSPEENAKTRAKVNEAKRLTIEKVTATTHEFLDLVKKVGVAADKAGDYMAWRNIIHGI